MLTALGAAALDARGDKSTAAPAFTEVFDLVRNHLQGFSSEQLDRAAVEGLLAALHPRVLLITNDTVESSAAARLSQARVFEDNVAYLRLDTVGEGLAALIAQAHRELTRTGSIIGLVLDLRYSTGEHYEVVGEVAGLLVKERAPLLEVDGQIVLAQPGESPWKLPVTVLVNRQTTGAAEALAAALRFQGVALLLGRETAGAAALRREFTLASGQTLRIASSPVKLADGSPLSPRGVQPDIAVMVAEADEALFFEDAYREAPTPTEVAAGTNRVARRPRPSEADLVRARREGLPLDGELVPPREVEPTRPVLRDPVLARAVDLLKGLAIVRAAQSSGKVSPD